MFALIEAPVKDFNNLSESTDPGATGDFVSLHGHGKFFSIIFGLRQLALRKQIYF